MKIQINKEGAAALKDVLAYIIGSEKRHWEETGRPKDHVYAKARQVQKNTVRLKE